MTTAQSQELRIGDSLMWQQRVRGRITDIILGVVPNLVFVEWEDKRTSLIGTTGVLEDTWSQIEKIDSSNAESSCREPENKQ